MPKIKALTPIEHDGKQYAEGDTLDVSEAQADQLIDGGFAVAKGGKTKAEKAAEVAAEAAAAAQAADAAAAAAAAEPATAEQAPAA